MDYDFNHRSVDGPLNALVDAACVARNQRQAQRQYLGGSIIGHECEKFLQFSFYHSPKDEGRGFSGRTIRIFDLGHCMEDLLVSWLRRDAGFNLVTEDPETGGQFSWELCDGLVAGHADGVFLGGSDIIQYPALFEAKSMKSSSWKKCQKEGVAKSHPVYHAQVQIYAKMFHLTENPALFVAVNKDTCEILFEQVKYNERIAQGLVEKAIRIVDACQSGEMLPRIAASPDAFSCKWCDFHSLCWR